MKIKDLLLPLGLALITTWLIQYFFFGKQGGEENSHVQSGQSFMAPHATQELKPLNVEIDFVDKKRSAPVVFSEVETEGARLVFSTDGASLERFEYKHMVDGHERLIDTVFPVSETEREDRCFLIAFAEKTPYFYQLIDRTDNENTVRLTYNAPFEGGNIQKTFTVYKDSYRLDLNVDIKVKDGFSVEPRIFYPSPIMADIVKTDVISAVMNNKKGGITKILVDKLNINEGWFAPKLFGTTDRYFVHAMVKDSDAFVQRAYYRLSGRNKAFSILEGPTITQQTSCELSFYFGPKVLNAMKKVDPLLEQTLDYAGWLSPIAKFFLLILKFLYKYLKNYGWAIVVLTILIKILTIPLTFKGDVSAKKQEEFQKKLRYIEQRYKHDREALTREKAELIRKHGMPGLTGALPFLLIQIPILYILNRLFSSSIELYKAPFLWIPDLASYDPYYILPVLVGIAIIMQPKMTSDPKQRLLSIFMALFFAAFSSKWAAGVLLYFLVSYLFSAVQSMIQKKFIC